MKTRLLLTTLIVTLLSACGSTEPLSIGMEDNGTQIEMQVGQQVVISLASNPTTGFGWHILELDEGVLTQVGEAEYAQAEADELLVGAGGTESLTFEAVAKGTTTLTLTYDRLWESVPPEQTFSLTIVIR